MSDDASGYPGAPPGWYADPAGGPGQRWWDGYAWTRRPPPCRRCRPPPPGFPPGATSPGARPLPALGRRASQGAQSLVANELRITSLGRFALAFPGLATLGNLIAWVANASP